ncbi:MAG: NusA-like transcription termination signal-binding factor [Candidatus Lokiarchaeota archaeon]|nr:NusA-like transcription termination signal-binding factor [Candidatus Lokiarchaeota archaeon]
MSVSIKLSDAQIRFISLFENITGAVARDCIIDDESERIIFIVKPGNIGLAIGKGGINIKRVREFINKDIDVVEFANSEELFIQNTLSPAKIKNVAIQEKRDGRRIALVTVDNKDRGIAIGKNGRNVARARLLAKRHYNIDDVIIN